MDVKELTAPCGLACWACAYYKDNITDELAQQTAQAIGMSVGEIACGGCRSERGCSWENPLTGANGCKTKKCVAEKGLHNCSECTDYPCEYLMPVVDGAERAPHNTKMYNLSRIRLIGLDAWAEEAVLIQQKYFKGKFSYGQAPILEDDSKTTK